MSVTLRFQSSGAVPGDGRPVVMRGPSLTIGRGAENDMVLPDPDRQISKTHCVIENHNGNLVVVDLSTNGTFLNYGKVPLGRTPTPLNDGDVLILGAYELVVQVSGSNAGVDERTFRYRNEGPAIRDFFPSPARITWHRYRRCRRPDQAQHRLRARRWSR